MHVITQARLQEFWVAHPHAETPLKAWHKQMKSKNFQNLTELQGLRPDADLVENFTIFDIGGNKYRLITYIDYKYRKVFIRHVLTHEEYDKNKWKDDDWSS